MSQFDKLFVSVPVDRKAAEATGKGFQYEPSKKVTVREWENRPPVRAPKPGEPELVGLRVGRLTVLGFVPEGKNGKHGATWVCRCDCGRYTSRKTKSLRNPNNGGDRCEQCRHVKYLKHAGSQERLEARK